MFIFACPFPDVAALMDLLYIKRSSAVRPTNCEAGVCHANKMISLYNTLSLCVNTLNK